MSTMLSSHRPMSRTELRSEYEAYVALGMSVVTRRGPRDPKADACNARVATIKARSADPWAEYAATTNHR